jgi:hypothetical protein
MKSNIQQSGKGSCCRWNHQDYFDPAPSKDDGLMMARSVTLPSIQFVLESMRNGSMYTLEQAKLWVEQNVFKKDSLHTVSHGPGGRIVRKDGKEDDMVVSAAETPIREEDINNINNLDDSDVEDDTNQTMYARNGVVSDIPLKLDLNEHTTVKLLIDSVEDLWKRCLDGTSTIGINAQGEVEAQGPSLDPDNIKGNPWSDNGWPVEDWPIPWMVRKTRHGNDIYTDRFVEWVVKDMRSSVGKFYVRGSDNAIEREALLLGLKKEFIAATTPARQNDPTTRGLGQVYCHTLAFMDKHKVWTDASRRFSFQQNKASISAGMIDLPSTGKTRVDYYTHIQFCHDGILEEEDGEWSTNKHLKHIQPTGTKQEESDNNNLARSTSTDYAFINANYTQKELSVEYDRMKIEYDEYQQLDGYNLVEILLEEKPVRVPSELLDVTLKHTGLDAAYLLSTRD